MKLPEAWRVFLPPAALSLALSVATVGASPQWQDSSIYLTAVQEYGVLYPPGFVLYLTLCKAWTLATAPLFGFTLAVHLFSSLCAAAAAGTLALAAWGLSRHVAASAAVGCLAASGYTWWFSGIYAKGYSLYALLVALLLLSLIRREQRRAVVLLALAWAAHPSAALLAPGVACHLWVHRREIRGLGRRALAKTACLALLCGLGPTLLLPLLSARQAASALGHVDSLDRLAAYAVGKKFIEMPDVWGWSTPRVLSVLRYAWEEFLGVGLLLVVLGVRTLRREDPGRLPALAIWCGVSVAVTTLFKIEGQHDLWLLAAWTPLWAAAALGLGRLALRWRFAPQALGAAGALWAVLANYGDLNQRGYDLAERFGAAHLRPLARDAILVLSSDDALGLCRYLQAVKGERPDVLLVAAPFLWSVEGEGWFFERLRRRRPGLKAPAERPPDPTADFSRVSPPLLAQAALGNANVSPEQPVYFEVPPPPRALRPDYAVARAGLLWRMVPKDAPSGPAEDVDGDAEEVARRMRRERGQSLKMAGDRLLVAPEPYEWRYLRVLLEARAARAERLVAAAEHRLGAELYASVLRLDRDVVFDGRCAFSYGTALAAQGGRTAALAFESALEKGGLTVAQEVAARLYLGDRHRAEGRESEARACYQRAAALPVQEASLRAEIERRLK